MGKKDEDESMASLQMVLFFNIESERKKGESEERSFRFEFMMNAGQVYRPKSRK